MKVRKLNTLSSPLVLNSLWPQDAIIANLQHEVCSLIGDESEGAIVLDEINHPPTRIRAVGAVPPNTQTSLRTNSSMTGVFLAYTRPGHGTVWIDRRLYLPPAWFRNPIRRAKAGIPRELPFKNKMELSFEMIRQAQANKLRFGFVVTNAYNQESSQLHQGLAAKGLVYVTAVSKNHHVFARKPNWPITHNRRSPDHNSSWPQLEEQPVTIETFVKEHESDWQRLGLRVYGQEEISADFAAWRVWPVAGQNQPASESWLIARRNHRGSRQPIYALCNAPQKTSLLRLAQMLSTKIWSKRALRHFEGDAGLAKFKMLGWPGWHHDLALTLLAMLYVLESQSKAEVQSSRMSVQQARELIQSEMAE